MTHAPAEPGPADEAGSWYAWFMTYGSLAPPLPAPAPERGDMVGRPCVWRRSTVSLLRRHCQRQSQAPTRQARTRPPMTSAAMAPPLNLLSPPPLVLMLLPGVLPLTPVPAPAVTSLPSAPTVDDESSVPLVVPVVAPMLPSLSGLFAVVAAVMKLVCWSAVSAVSGPGLTKVPPAAAVLGGADVCPPAASWRLVASAGVVVAATKEVEAADAVADAVVAVLTSVVAAVVGVLCPAGVVVLLRAMNNSRVMNAFICIAASPQRDVVSFELNSSCLRSE